MVDRLLRYAVRVKGVVGFDASCHLSIVQTDLITASIQFITRSSCMSGFKWVSKALCQISRVRLLATRLTSWQNDRACFEKGINLHPPNTKVLVQVVRKAADIVYIRGNMHRYFVLLSVYKVTCF